MTFKVNANSFAAQALTNTNTVAQMPLGTIFTGQDPNLGYGEFMYVQGTGTILINDVVEFTGLLASPNFGLLVQEWAGAANQGKLLGVALGVLTGNLFGWVQITGIAVVNTTGTPALGNPAYFGAAGTVQPTAVAGKQVMGGQFMSANNVSVGGAVIGAAKALLFLNRAVGQGQIT